jgi:hypothetical protein
MKLLWVLLNALIFAGAQSGKFVASQERLFKTNGLDIKLIQISSSSRGVQEILVGELALFFMDATHASQANLKGGHFVSGVGATTRQVFSLIAKLVIGRNNLAAVKHELLTGYSSQLTRLFCAPDEIMPHRFEAVGCVNLFVFNGCFCITSPRRIAGSGRH